MPLLLENKPPQNLGFPGGSDSKEYACNAGDPGSIPGQEDPLEKGMATHSSILAWKIPWTEEPGGLPKKSDMTERLILSASNSSLGLVGAHSVPWQQRHLEDPR